MHILRTLKMVLWSVIGIGGGRKKGDDFKTNPVVLIAIGLQFLAGRPVRIKSIEIPANTVGVN